jgi:hypothetical protein
VNAPASTPEQQPQMDGHQQMAARIHNIFAQGAGVQVSSAQAEAVVELKLWLAAIVNGQLKIVDQAAPTVVPPLTPGSDGAPPN